MEGVLYYPYINVPNGPWLIGALLYWDGVATIAPYSARRSFNELTLELARLDLVTLVEPTDALGCISTGWWRYLEKLDPRVLEGRRRNFSEGGVVRLHEEKLFYDQSFAAACDLGLANPPGSRGSGRWAEVESHTARDYMAALAIALTDPRSRFAGRQPSLRWLPATDGQQALLDLVGGESRFPERAEDWHTSRLRSDLRHASIRAVVLDRLFPVPDGAQIDALRLAGFREEFGPELRAFRRQVERRLLEIARLSDTDSQVREIDLLGDEFEDEILRAEAHLLELGVTKITRSTFVQLARHLDPSGVIDKIAKGAEEVLGVADKPLGPLAYAALARLEVFGRRDRPHAVPILDAPSRSLVDSFKR